MTKQSKSQGIQIPGSEINILSLLLEKIPEQDKTSLIWSLLYVDGILKKGNIDTLEETINNQQYGKVVSWEEITSIVKDLNQAWNFLLIANSEKNSSISADMDENTIYHSSFYVIELFDSSYYRVYSMESDYINTLVKNLDKKKYFKMIE